VPDHTTSTPQKTCSKCGETKPATNEHFNRSGKGNALEARCKDCVRAYRQANLDKLREYDRNRRNTPEEKAAKAEYDRAYRETNPSYNIERCRKWRELNIEYVREQQRAAYAANPEPAKERARIWYKANKERATEYNRAHYAANKEQYAERARAYRVANKERIAAYREANKERIAEQLRSWREANRDHIAEYDRAYREANKEQHRKWWRNWYIANPHKVKANTHRRRARKLQAEGTHTAADIQAQYKAQKGKCYYCAAKVGDTYHVDHVIPLSRGGSNSPENLVIACPPCNLSKGDKLPSEWSQGGRLL